LILGASYKAGVGDTRESPALRIIDLLRDRGAIIDYHDRYVPVLPALGLTSIELPDDLSGYEAVVLVTAHPAIDYAAVLERSRVLVDLRGATRKLAPAGQAARPPLAATAS
jgi:UDP-N-acetyl-D-glucosamine dehydrogenase